MPLRGMWQIVARIGLSASWRTRAGVRQTGSAARRREFRWICIRETPENAADGPVSSAICAARSAPLFFLPTSHQPPPTQSATTQRIPCLRTHFPSCSVTKCTVSQIRVRESLLSSRASRLSRACRLSSRACRGIWRLAVREIPRLRFRLRLPGYGGHVATLGMTRSSHRDALHINQRPVLTVGPHGVR